MRTFYKKIKLNDPIPENAEIETPQGWEPYYDKDHVYQGDEINDSEYVNLRYNAARKRKGGKA